MHGCVKRRGKDRSTDKRSQKRKKSWGLAHKSFQTSFFFSKRVGELFKREVF